jgi:hypothetical protein
VPEGVSKVHREKERKNEAERRRGDNGAHRKMEISPAIVADCGGERVPCGLFFFSLFFVPFYFMFF